MEKRSKFDDRNLNGQKNRKNLQELRAMHFSSHPPETAAAQTGETPEIPDAQVDSSDHYEQASQIMQSFLDHYQSAKKVRDLLKPFLDIYQRCQEDLKKPDIPGPQLHQMDFEIQASLDRVNKHLTSDQRLAEIAKVGIKELLLAGTNTEISKLKELLNNPQSFGPDTETILGERQRALANMTKWNQKLAKFSKKLEQSNITTLDQLRNNLIDLLSEIRNKKKIMAEKDLEDDIKTIGRKIDMVSRDPQIASNEDIYMWRKQLDDAIAYKEQESTSTADGLIHQCFILRYNNTRLDVIIKEIIFRKEIDNASKAHSTLQMIDDIKPNDLGTCLFHNFKIGSVLDGDALKWLANDFHEALNREKQPQALYRVLYFLLRESEAIEKLNDVYQENYNQTLETALNERFKKPEDRPQLEYALQLIKKGDTCSEQTIELRPPIKQNVNEFPTVAQRIHLALHPASGEPQIGTIYAALTSLVRHTESLCHVDAHYSSLYGKGLKSDIENTLKGEAKDHALFLLGDPIGERNAKSWLEAVNWHKVLSKQTFDRGDGVHVPIPYDGLLQSGRTWTHILGQALKEAGLRSKKIIALSLYNNANGWKQPGLDVHMNLAPDRPDGKNTRIYQRMAPLIEVETPFGTVELVLDPSLSSKPLTIKQWMSKMGHNTFERMSHDDYIIKQRDEPFQENPADRHPSDRPYAVIANRNIPVYSPKACVK